jgi:hypothetical protein
MVKSVEKSIDPRSIMQAPTKCRFCGSEVKYTTHAEIYNGRTFSDWPYIYLCTNKACGASVGVHAGTTHPLGTLADEKTKTARKAAHAAFDPIWKSKQMSRGEAYKWLAYKLDIERWRCHISWFDADLCQRVVKLCAHRQESI